MSVLRARGITLREAELHRALDRDAHDPVHRVDPLGLVQEVLLPLAHEHELGPRRHRAELAHGAHLLLLLQLLVDALADPGAHRQRTDHEERQQEPTEDERTRIRVRGLVALRHRRLLFHDAGASSAPRSRASCSETSGRPRRLRTNKAAQSAASVTGTTRSSHRYSVSTSSWKAGATCQ